MRNLWNQLQTIDRGDYFSLVTIPRISQAKNYQDWEGIIRDLVYYGDGALLLIAAIENGQEEIVDLIRELRPHLFERFLKRAVDLAASEGRNQFFERLFTDKNAPIRSPAIFADLICPVDREPYAQYVLERVPGNYFTPAQIGRAFENAVSYAYSSKVHHFLQYLLESPHAGSITVGQRAQALTTLFNRLVEDPDRNLFPTLNISDSLAAVLQYDDGAIPEESIRQALVRALSLRGKGKHRIYEYYISVILAHRGAALSVATRQNIFNDIQGNKKAFGRFSSLVVNNFPQFLEGLPVELHERVRKAQKICVVL